MSIRYFLYVLMSVLSLCLSANAAADAKNYRYQLVASTGDRFTALSAPAINNLHEVAFNGTLKNGDLGIYSDRNGDLNTIVPRGVRSGLTLDDAGAIYFSYPFFQTFRGGGIYSIWNGKTRAILPEGRVGSWATNNRGSVVYSVEESMDDVHLYLNRQGQITELRHPESRSPARIDGIKDLTPTYFFNHMHSAAIKDAAAQEGEEAGIA